MRTLIATVAMAMASMATANTLTLPTGFYALEVNGAPAQQQGRSLALGEGKQVVTLRYINPYISHPESNDFYSSKPQYLVFDAGQGEHGLMLVLDDRRQYDPYKADLKFHLEADGQAVAMERYSGHSAIAAALAD
ncbi:DUF2057 domain-containing protein [Ferrimonas sediminicola]|uniref:DUF2057 domain-containing protein n=1 Tax=Ferrimonas sediminicola TaxID=2569538 RepID=A0A4V5NV38_9GAMM|nr:DUF2057 family protein [Ferrimonas sediminicola]TKB48904.1 DUF2057 domain-containing protein [Ferrimonas sediminicola]